MRNQLQITFIGFIVLLFTGGFIINPDHNLQDNKNVDIIISKVDGVWKVTNQETSSSVIKVKRNDKITWKAVGTDVKFQFPSDNLFKPETEGDAMPDGYTKFVKDGKKFKLKVKENAPLGVVTYSIFCYKDKEFAVGSSPPRIIIEDFVID